LYTDASGNFGYGAVFGSWWFANSWPKQLMSYSIAVKELELEYLQGLAIARVLLCVPSEIENETTDQPLCWFCL
jgi:hypothetical protein